MSDQRASDMTEILESSVHAVQSGGRFVPSWELPDDAALTAVHAELARLCRSSRRLRVWAVLPMPEAT